MRLESLQFNRSPDVRRYLIQVDHVSSCTANRQAVYLW
jgi:hypothetical protein